MGDASWCWRELLRSSRPDARLFSALHAWRSVLLREKHRVQPPSSDAEALQLAFVEDELPLHLAVVALDASDRAAFDLLGYVSSRFPACVSRLDAKRRSALVYAIHRRWSVEHLEWIADKTATMILEKDIEGLSVVIYAVMQRCPQELIVRLAVSAALRCIAAIDELMEGRHTESARRFCQRCLLDYFAGVPKFPYASSRFALRSDSRDSDVVNQVRVLWVGFADQWGHDGPPLIQHDLPTELRVPIESSVEVSITAKGEPLSYQWFINEVAIEGATLPLLYLSQSIQTHNAGVYSCEVRNQKGRALSTAMELLVVDDRVRHNPTAAFRVDKSNLGSAFDAWRNVKAAAGAFLCHPVTGVAVLLAPNFFKCLDANGDDVSNSLGADIALCDVSSSERKVDTEPHLRLQAGDQLISSVVDIMPSSIGNLLRPATACIPHSLAVDDRFYKPVVVEIDVGTGTCRDVDSLPTCFGAAAEASWSGCPCARISRLGRFAVVARKLPGNLELEAPLEQLQLVLVRPRTISSASIRAQDVPQVPASLWMIRDRPDAVKDWENGAGRFALEPGTKWGIDRFRIRARRGQVFCVRAGGADLIVHHWDPPPLHNAESYRPLGGHSFSPIASNIMVDLGNTPDNREGVEWSAFCTVTLNVSICKLTHAINSKNRETLLHPATIADNTVALSESGWTALIALEHDESMKQPASTPVLQSRTRSHLVLDLNPASTVPFPTRRAHESVDAREFSEDERATTPYYCVVEMASFSESFWARYDKTWWFDKTKTEVINGMYKVVHHGYDRSVTIATSAFAACIRVARCSVDHFGEYSEPLLIEPLGRSDGQATESGDQVPHSPSVSDAASPSGESQALQMTAQHLGELIKSHYRGEDVFQRVYGTSSVQIPTKLEAIRTEARAANYELSLLLMGLTRLRKQLAQINVASAWYTEKLSCVLALERFVPELDHSPERFAAVIGQLHQLVQDAFSLAWKLSSDGWLERLLRREWLDQDVDELERRVAELLITEARDLRGAVDLYQHLGSKDTSKVPWISIAALQYLLLVAGGLSVESQRRVPASQRIALSALCHSLAFNSDETIVSPTLGNVGGAEGDTIRIDHLAARLYKEVEMPGFRDALSSLQREDSLPNHLILMSPKDGEACPSIPKSVQFYLDDGIVGLSDSGLYHAVKVVNLSRDWSSVQGKIEFSGADATLAFVPSMPFEKRCRYRVFVKPHELVTSLGATLPKIDEPLVFHFSTPAHFD